MTERIDWDDLNAYLAPTPFIESQHASIAALVDRLGLSSMAPRARAVAAFRFVQNEIRYEFVAKLAPEYYQASRVLADGRGFCVQKAVLLCALGRAAGLPTALVVSDLRDRTLPEALVQALKTDVFYHHGLNAFHLDGRWIQVDASLSSDLAERRGYLLPSFDGVSEALLSPVTRTGEPHTEYVAFHGRFPDLSFEGMMRAFAVGYAQCDFAALGKVVVRM